MSFSSFSTALKNKINQTGSGGRQGAGLREEGGTGGRDRGRLQAPRTQDEFDEEMREKMDEGGER